MPLSHPTLSRRPQGPRITKAENVTLVEYRLRSHLISMLRAVLASQVEGGDVGVMNEKVMDAEELNHAATSMRDHLQPICEEHVPPDEKYIELTREEVETRYPPSRPLRLFVSTVGVRGRSQHGWELAIMGELFDTRQSFPNTTPQLLASLPHLSVCVVSLVNPSQPW